MDRPHPTTRSRARGISDLEDHVGYWLRCLSNQVHVTFERALAGHEVSVAQWVVLRTLYRLGPTSVGQLADLVRTDQGATSRLIDRLLAKGLVSKQVSASDRRGATVSLSKAGEALIPKLAREADENDSRFFGVLRETDREQFLRTIRKLIAANGIDARAHD